MADQSRGRGPRRKSRPRGERKSSTGPSRAAQGEIRHDENREELLASMAPEELMEENSQDLDDPGYEAEPAHEAREERSERGHRDRGHRDRPARGQDRGHAEGGTDRYSERPRDNRSDSRGNERGEPGNRYESAEGEPQRSPAPRPAPRTMPEEEFVVQVFFDRGSNQFVASCLEFPDLKVQGHRREDVVEELTQKIGDELEMMRREGRPLPTPFAGRAYPEKLEVKISRNLYRRLDMQSRQDRVPLDQLVTELLTAALNRRPDGFGKAQENRRQQGQGQHGQQQKGQGNHNRRGGERGGGGGGRNRNYHDTMGNRDNFLEYVRNLEKGGGFTKKR